MNNYKYLIIFIQKIENFDSKVHFPSISIMTSSMMTSLNYCQKMSSLSKNSCAKAFGNWSKGKKFRLKKPRGGSTNPPASLRVNKLWFETYLKTSARCIRWMAINGGVLKRIIYLLVSQF